MNWEDMARELAYTTDSKIVLLVCDGLGGLPIGGRTELEAARKPNLDEAARLGACGVTDPVFMGITPGSGPAHLALFGYDPLRTQLGRGILEALDPGSRLVGMTLSPEATLQRSMAGWSSTAGRGESRRQRTNACAP